MFTQQDRQVAALAPAFDQQAPDRKQTVSVRSKSTATIIVKRRLDDPYSGSAVYLLNCFQALEEAGFSVRIVATPRSSFGSRPFSRPHRIFRENGRSIIWPETIRLGSIYLARDMRVWLRSANRLMRGLVWNITGRRAGARPSIPSTLGLLPDADEVGATVKTVNSIGSSLVIGEYSSLGPILDQCRGTTRAVLLHDLFSLRSEAFLDAKLAPDHASPSFDDEVMRLKNVDLCIHASSTEAAAIKAELSECCHVWLPPRISENLIKGHRRKRPRIVFIGVKHGGNREALSTILETIWPTVRQARPEAELWIVGEISETLEAVPPGVVLRRHIADLSELAGPDTIGFAPTRVMSGISIKIATYLEQGMCVVCHTKTLDAYAGKLDDLVCHAETDEALASTLIELLDDPEKRREIASQGAQLARERLSNAELVDYLRTLDVQTPQSALVTT